MSLTLLKWSKSIMSMAKGLPLRAARAKRLGLDDAAMRAELQRVVTINLAAVGVSAMGLAAVVAGILLG